SYVLSEILWVKQGSFCGNTAFKSVKGRLKSTPTPFDLQFFSPRFQSWEKKTDMIRRTVLTVFDALSEPEKNR
ncbi:MAG: hypothetical protein KDC70_15785, partial [Saprospiraceae bacterium]|nr:hypothetical protein [Saprospiraceae bacterium]